MGSEALAPARPEADDANDAPIPGETPALARWPELRPFLREVVARYGSRLHSVLLYGSRARGEERADSDYDLSIVFRGEFERLAVRRWLGETAHDLRWPPSSSWIGPDIQPYAIPASRLEHPREEDFYARNIAMDGIALIGERP